MKLWVDDIRNPPDDSWHIARSVGAAVRALDMFYRDITDINLDHDISHQVLMGGKPHGGRPFACEETFETVARHIALLKDVNTALVNAHGVAEPWNPKIRIHTSNFNGAHNMKAILEQSGLFPEVMIAPGANRLETIL